MPKDRMFGVVADDGGDGPPLRRKLSRLQLCQMIGGAAQMAAAASTAIEEGCSVSDGLDALGDPPTNLPDKCLVT